MFPIGTVSQRLHLQKMKAKKRRMQTKILKKTFRQKVKKKSEMAHRKKAMKKSAAQLIPRSFLMKSCQMK